MPMDNYERVGFWIVFTSFLIIGSIAVMVSYGMGNAKGYQDRIKVDLGLAPPPAYAPDYKAPSYNTPAQDSYVPYDSYEAPARNNSKGVKQW